MGFFSTMKGRVGKVFSDKDSKQQRLEEVGIHSAVTSDVVDSRRRTLYTELNLVYQALSDTTQKMEDKKAAIEHLATIIHMVAGPWCRSHNEQDSWLVLDAFYENHLLMKDHPKRWAYLLKEAHNVIDYSFSRIDVTIQIPLFIKQPFPVAIPKYGGGEYSDGAEDKTTLLKGEQE